MNASTRGLALGLTTAAALAGPSALSVGPVRRALTPHLAAPGLSGLGAAGHLALTFDDGPDRASTPHFLALLDRLGVRATFFVLGAHVRDHGLLAEMAAAGHEVGVHGWDHRPVVLHTPTSLRIGLLRTRDLVEAATGQAARWYRPPYGLLAAHAWGAARAAALRLVLWSAWGRDWERSATPESVAGLVRRQVRPGGTVLLHDSDRTSAPGSWRATLEATARLVPGWLATGLEVGPLREHGLAP